jgi:hypothetical protein
MKYMQPSVQLSLLGLEGAVSSLSRLLARECVCVYVCQFVTECDRDLNR